MGYIVGAILIIITLLIIGLILRKKIYDEVDKQDEWKFDVMNRNVAAEISRIKKLNLSGETQEKFEDWKQQWENIITKKMGEVENNLLEAEEAADRYRFSKAKKALRSTDGMLRTIEEEIKSILNDLEILMETEKTSREDAGKVEPDINALKSRLSQNRHQYGKAEAVFDRQISEMKEQLEAYQELTEAGNYMEARELMENLKTNVAILQENIIDFPEIYHTCKYEYPGQLSDLKHGLKDMEDEGFHIAHLGYEKEIREFEGKITSLTAELDQGNIEDAKKFIPLFDNRIREMYQVLEDEAKAKGYVHSKLPGYQSAVDEAAAAFTETKREVDKLTKAYYIEQEDMEKFHVLERQINKLQKQYQQMSADLDGNTSSNLEMKEKIDEGFLQLASIQEKHTGFTHYMETIRGDEMKSREQLSQLQDQIQTAYRRLKKSNIPGVPGFIYSSIEKSTQKIDQVLNTLNKQPLDMAQVQDAITEAKKANDQLVEQTDTILDQAYYTEQVIQYANRYRSRYPQLAEELKESERLFRSYEYELSLEKAARAVEVIEPGALKKIEENREMMK